MNRKTLRWFPIALLMLGLAPLSCGQSGGSPPAGTLDTRFGIAGKVTTAIETSAAAFALAIQSDGKLVAAGYSNTNNGTQNEFALVRYNTDGGPDHTFNATGMVTTAIGTSDDVAFAVAIQPDGKLIAAGHSWTGAQHEFALVRYNPNGSLDVTFHATGKVTTAIGNTNDMAYALAIQPDGKLVAAGSSFNSTMTEIALVRYNPDGSLDTTFHTTGIVTTAIGTVSAQALALVIQSDGKLVVAGRSWTGTQYEFALVRYSTDGNLDTTFHGTGIVTTAVGTVDDAAYALAVQPDGKLAAAGYSDTGIQREFALVRYNPDGSLDTTFLATGVVTTAIGTSDDEAFALAIQSDGKLVAAGYSSTNNGTQNEFALARYNTDGSPDPTFNATGIVTTAVGSVDDIAFALMIQADGKLIAAGSSYHTVTQYEYALVRYWP